MGGEIEPRRLALRFTPPAIVVEYARRQSYRTQLYHHEIDIQPLLPTSRTAPLTDWAVNDIVDQIVEQHGSVLEGVSPEQLKRLVAKLARSDSESATAPATAPAEARLPQADYNRVSENQLRQVKDRMNVVFEKNIVKPGDQGYRYDKQVVFTPSEAASDWDDD